MYVGCTRCAGGILFLTAPTCDRTAWITCFSSVVCYVFLTASCTARPIRACGRALAHLFLAVAPQTPARCFRSALQDTSEGSGVPGWAPQNAGDGLLIPSNTSLWQAPGEGDFVLEVSMSIV